MDAAERGCELLWGEDGGMNRDKVCRVFLSPPGMLTLKNPADILSSSAEHRATNVPVKDSILTLSRAT